jgi:hypothetical protein
LKRLSRSDGHRPGPDFEKEYLEVMPTCSGLKYFNWYLEKMPTSVLEPEFEKII